MPPKTVDLVIAGGSEDGHREVVVAPGTTAAWLVANEGIGSYQLSLGPGFPFIAGQDMLYDQMEDRGKLYATSRALQG